jgi:hypothetical protein
LLATSDAAHAQVFDLEEVLDAVLGALAAHAGFLHAAEGRDLGGDDAGVDADDAVFQGLGDAPDAADVAGVEVGGEAEFGVVGHRITSASSSKRKTGRPGRRFPPSATSMSGVTSATRVGSKNVPPRAWRLPPEHACALGDGVGDVLLDLSTAAALISGPCCTPSHAVADLQFAETAFGQRSTKAS